MKSNRKSCEGWLGIAHFVKIAAADCNCKEEHLPEAIDRFPHPIVNDTDSAHVCPKLEGGTSPADEVFCGERLGKTGSECMDLLLALEVLKKDARSRHGKEGRTEEDAYILGVEVTHERREVGGERQFDVRYGKRGRCRGRGLFR